MIKQFLAALFFFSYGLFALSQSQSGPPTLPTSAVRMEAAGVTAKKVVPRDPFEEAQLILKQEAAFHEAERERNMRLIEVDHVRNVSEQSGKK